MSHGRGNRPTRLKSVIKVHDSVHGRDRKSPFERHAGPMIKVQGGHGRARGAAAIERASEIVCGVQDTGSHACTQKLAANCVDVWEGMANVTS